MIGPDKMEVPYQGLPWYIRCYYYIPPYQADQYAVNDGKWKGEKIKKKKYSLQRPRDPESCHTAAIVTVSRYPYSVASWLSCPPFSFSLLSILTKKKKKVLPLFSPVMQYPHMSVTSKLLLTRLGSFSSLTSNGMVIIVQFIDQCLPAWVLAYVFILFYSIRLCCAFSLPFNSV
ncbi:hypothetical protein GGR52DRAFT_345847 [Hypoxylon sp. FL1284]|nr:hypothetical protein GGR52DRAFT_345847 [Hypoxylon sp. FL1284]